jgi:virginiamycin B lyase
MTPEIVSVLDLGNAGPYAIAFGPDGAMWVTLVNTGELLRRLPDGRERRFTIGERPGQIAITAQATWCAISGEDRVARVTDDRVTYIDTLGEPYGVAATNTDVWVSLMRANKLALITDDSISTDVTMPVDSSYPAMIAAHEDGSVWCSLNQAGALARRDPTGGVDIIDLPADAAPVGIATTGQNVWATDIARGRIFQVDQNLHIREFVLDPDSRPHAVIADTNGCWFTEWGANRLGRITHEGKLLELALSQCGDEPHGLAFDKSGHVWIAFESGTVVAVKGVPS